MWLSLLVSLAFARSDVAILLSDNLAAYDAPMQRFGAVVGRPVTVYDLHGDRARADAIVKQLQADPPPLIYALGAKAAYVAVNELPTIPTVYAMVIDPARYGIGGTQVTGVSMDVPPEAILSQFRLFAPGVKRLGVLLAARNNGAATAAALDAGKQLGFDMHVVRVTNERDVRPAFRRMADDVDAIWLLNDPVVVTPDVFRFLRTETQRRKIPMLAENETLVRAGALMCIAPDREMIGQQAGEIAARILDKGDLPGVIEPPPPGAIRVVLNRDTLDAVGLKVDDVMLDFADEVVREDAGR